MQPIFGKADHAWDFLRSNRGPSCVGAGRVGAVIRCRSREDAHRISRSFRRAVVSGSGLDRQSFAVATVAPSWVTPIWVLSRSFAPIPRDRRPRTLKGSRTQGSAVTAKTTQQTCQSLASPLRSLQATVTAKVSTPAVDVSRSNRMEYLPTSDHS